MDRCLPSLAGLRPVGKTQKAVSPQAQAWVDARKRHHLSHLHVQMARELGLNPRKLGKIDNHRQEPWKAPLPQFIEHLYLKRFGRERPLPSGSPSLTARPTPSALPGRPAIGHCGVMARARASPRLTTKGSFTDST